MVPLLFPLLTWKDLTLMIRKRLRMTKKDQIYTNLAILKLAMISPCPGIIGDPVLYRITVPGGRQGDARDIRPTSGWGI